MTLDLSIIIVSYNVRSLLRACLDSVFAQRTSHSFDVWVIDNASVDGSAHMVRDDYPAVHLIANADNRGYGPANNQGIEASTGKLVMILNPDTEICSGSIDNVIDYIEQHPDVALVGCRLVYADGSFQHSVFRFPGLGQAFLDLFPLHPKLLESALNGRYPRQAYEQPVEVDHPLGACFMMRRTGLQFDEDYFMYSEEIDLCWRIKKAGWKVMYLPELTVLHHAGQSTRQAPVEMRRQLFRSRRLFNRKHRGPLFRAGWELIARAGHAPLD